MTLYKIILEYTLKDDEEIKIQDLIENSKDVYARIESQLASMQITGMRLTNQRRGLESQSDCEVRYLKPEEVEGNWNNGINILVDEEGVSQTESEVKMYIDFLVDYVGENTPISIKINSIMNLFPVMSDVIQKHSRYNFAFTNIEYQEIKKVS